MGKRKFGGRGGIRIGRIQDHDAALGGSGHIDVVDADTCAADDFQPSTGRNNGRGDASLGAYNDAIIFPDALSELLFAQVRRDNHVKSRPRGHKALRLLVNRVSNENPMLWKHQNALLVRAAQVKTSDPVGSIISIPGTGHLGAAAG